MKELKTMLLVIAAVIFAFAPANHAQAAQVSEAEWEKIEEYSDPSLFAFAMDPERNFNAIWSTADEAAQYHSATLVWGTLEQVDPGDQLVVEYPDAPCLYECIEEAAEGSLMLQDAQGRVRFWRLVAVGEYFCRQN